MSEGSFSQVNKKLKKLNIIAYDSEDNSKGVVTEHCFYGKDGPFHTYSHEEAMDYIYSRPEPTIFVAHNLEYDIANLMRHDDYLMVDEMIYTGQLLKVTLAGTEHYFINSHSFFAGTVEKMGKIVGLEKLTPDAGQAYVTRDAEIVYRFMDNFQNKLVDDMGVNLGITIGQMCMETYRRDYMLSPQQKTWNSKNCLKAYYGGRVEIFYKGVIKDVYTSDINSCYPDVMRNEFYPDTGDIGPSSIYTHEYGIGKFRVQVPSDTHIPVLPYRSENGKLFFPVGTFTGWWTYAEVRYAMKHGTKIIKEYQGEGTNRYCEPFKNFIDVHYSLRLESKNKLYQNPLDHGAAFDDLFYKLWCNNLYGKWAQHNPAKTLTREKWPTYKTDKLIEQHKENFKTSKIGPFYSYEVPKLEPPKHANFMWGVYVTSYARIKLHQGLMLAHNGGFKVLYCDTDSVMYHRPDTSASPYLISKKLGEWDEDHFGLGAFAQAKGYLLCQSAGKNEYEIEKVACKGVNTHFAYDFIIEGMAKFLKPMRMKEALIRAGAAVNKDKDLFLEEIGENFWSEVEKEMKSIYIKRKGSQGVTFPVDVGEIKELEAKAIQDNDFSIKKELEKNAITIKKPFYKNTFTDIKLPDRLGKRNAAREYKPGFQIPSKIQCVRVSQMEGFSKGAIWMSGHIVAHRKTKRTNKNFYVLYLESYKNKKCPPNFFKGLWAGFFEDYGVSENLVGKKVAITLKDTYLKKTKPEFDIKISSSNFPSANEEEISDSDLKTLKSMDWSSIKWIT